MPTDTLSKDDNDGTDDNDNTGDNENTDDNDNIPISEALESNIEPDQRLKQYKYNEIIPLAQTKPHVEDWQAIAAAFLPPPPSKDEINQFRQKKLSEKGITQLANADDHKHAREHDSKRQNNQIPSQNQIASSLVRDPAMDVEQWIASLSPENILQMLQEDFSRPSNSSL